MSYLLFPALILTLGNSLTCAETYYKNYQIFKPTTYSIVSTESACISSCLSSLTCSAVSLCYASTSLIFCAAASCGNIRLLAATNETCRTIVFANAMLEGSNFPQADSEWILTDVCGGSSYPNTGLSDTSSVSLQHVSGSTAAQSTFFGNSYMFSAVNLTASPVYINTSESFTFFYWFKVNTATSRLNLLNFEFVISRITRFLRVTYSNKYLVFSSDFTGTTQAFSNYSNVALDNNKWHSFAIVYAPASSFASFQLYLDNAVQLSGDIIYPPVPQDLKTIITANWQNNSALISGTLYCLKFYKAALQQADILNIGNSCLLGEVNLMASLPQPVSSISPFSLVAIATYNNINIMTYYCSATCPVLTQSSVEKKCQSVGYEAAQLANPNALNALKLTIQSSVLWKGPVVGASYNATLGSYLWTASGIPLTGPWCSTKNTPISDYPMIYYDSSQNCYQNISPILQTYVLAHYACTSQ